MKTTTRYSPEVRERAVRLVFEHQGEYESQWAALASIAAKWTYPGLVDSLVLLFGSFVCCRFDLYSVREIGAGVR